MDITEALKILTRGSNLRVLPGGRLIERGSQAATTEPLLGKRKRESPPPSAEKSAPEDAGTVLKRHKIKITDVTALQEAKLEAGTKVKKDRFRVCPTPVASFSQLRERFDVHPSLAKNLADQGYVEPTEVQMATLPLLLESESPPNLLTVAPTGSGKTVAYLAPLIQGIIRARSKPVLSSNHTKCRSTTVIILVPTKELLFQTLNEGRKLIIGTGVTISAVRKGVKLTGLHEAEQLDDEEMEACDSDEQPPTASKGVKSDILISTPANLSNALCAGSQPQALHLPNILHLVLDEADLLLDSQFREDTLAVWKACSSQRLQVSLWSATMGSNIEELAIASVRERGTAPRIPSQLLRCVVGIKDSALSSITHRMIYAGSEHGKMLGLRNYILHPIRDQTLAGKKQTPLRYPFLVYTQTIERAEALYSELLYDIPARADGLQRIAVLHSDLSDSKRADVMTRFRKATIWVLITTDLLSRGIDFRGINGIVNYDMPTTAASYVHRVGRAGRAGREGGVAVTLWTEEDRKYVKIIANAIVTSNGGNINAVEGLGDNPSWIMESAPVSKRDKKDLKQRGVLSRRGTREGDDEKATKAKRLNRIGTKRGYLLQKENNRKGAIEASKRRKEVEVDESEWDGLED